MTIIRRDKRCFVNLLICISLFIQSTNTITYYLSSSNGSDSNNGTTPMSAWKTFNHVATLNLKPNDQILLKSGDVWSEQLIINNANGTEINSILISSYDTSINYHRAYINILNTQYENSSNIICYNCIGIIFNFLELSGGRFGISFYYNIKLANVSLNYINISHCYFHNINGKNIMSTSAEGWGSAIIFGSSISNSIFINKLYIEHNIMNQSDTFFNNYFGKYFGYPYTVNINIGHIYGCTFTNNYYNIVYLGRNAAMTNFHVDSCLFMYDHPVNAFYAGVTDIIIEILDNTSSILNNEIGWRLEYYNNTYSGPDGCGIDFETGSNGTIVYNNYIHNTFGASIMILGHPNTNNYNYNINIINNVLIENGCDNTKNNDHGSIAFLNPSSGICENNYFVKCINQSIPIFWNGGNQNNDKNWSFTNNTILNYTNDNIVQSPIVDIECDRNNKQIINVNASCLMSDCILYYSIDGTRPSQLSNKYNGQMLEFMTAISIAFKGFVNGMIESSSVGAIINPKLCFVN